MKKMTASILMCMLFSAVIAQSTPFDAESWNPKPVLHQLDKKYNDESAIIISDIRRVEFVDDAKGQLQAYKTLHKIIHINDDKGIEIFNKAYLPLTDNADIVDIRARTILPNGKIIEVDKKNIKDLQEDDRTYKIFAMEGLEPGCEVEYYYTYKYGGSFFGREVLQSRVPVLSAQMRIVSPERLLFEMKTFNSREKAVDTILNSKRYTTLSIPAMAGAQEEKYSTQTANMVRAEYKLAYNTSKSNTERLFVWNELAKRVHEIYGSYSDKEMKKSENLVKDNKWDKLTTEKEKIVAIENYIKKTIATRDDIGGEDAENIEKILKNKIASHRGITRLYGAIFQAAGINIQIVLSGNREDYVIDKSFENWNNCENLLIYFVNLKKFLSPTSIEYRFPWIPAYWGSTNALFCKTTTIGNFTTAIAEIKQVPLEDYKSTGINTEAKIQLNKSADSLMVDIKQIYFGYAAGIYRSIFNFADAEQQKQFTKEMVKFGTKSESIISSKLENTGFEHFNDNKPFILSASVKASELVEKTRDKVLVKIGDIIGPQVEMYQEKARQFPMEIEYPHVLERKIEFIIPDGYIIKNLNELNINKTYQENGQTTMGFVSGFKQEGNVITVSILEEYRKVIYPLSQYEDFEKIINAAADFNKVILVLEKK